MNIGIHKTHRALARIYMNCKRSNGQVLFTLPEYMTVMALLEMNAELVHKLDSLKELAFHAHEVGDFEWEQEICKQIEELEAQCI